MKLGVRDAGKVFSKLHISEDPSAPTLVKAGMSFIIPVRFNEIGLAQLGAKTFAYGLGLLVLDTGEYTLLNVSAMLELGDCTTQVFTEDEVDYYRFHFTPGSAFIKTRHLVCQSSLLFIALDEFIFKGKMAKYLSYDDAMRIFDTAQKHTRTSATILHPVVEFIIGYIGRSRADRKTYIRLAATKPSDYSLKNLSWVPMRSVYWSAPSTVNKTGGAYFPDGVVSALVNPSVRSDNIEKILRA